MRLGVVFMRVVQVVGGHQWQVEVLGQPQQVPRDPAFDVQAMVHQFAEIVLRTKNVTEFRSSFKGLAVLAQPQPGLDFPRRAASGGDQAFGVCVQELAVQARPLAEDCVQRGNGRRPEEVAHAGIVVAQERHVGIGPTTGDVIFALVFLAPAHTAFVRPRGAGGDVGFDADNRLDPLVRGALPEIESPEQVPVVGSGQGRHAEAFSLVEELTQAGCAVQHGVFGVVMEMDERGIAGSHRTILSAGDPSAAQRPSR